MVFVEVFFAFSAIAALLIGISGGRLSTNKEQHGGTLIARTLDAGLALDVAGQGNSLVVSRRS